MNDGNSVTELVIDGLVALELLLGLMALVVLSVAIVSTISHVAGFANELSFTLSLFAASGVLLLTAVLAFLTSIEVQHFSAD